MGFARFELDAGESRRALVPLGAEAMALLDDEYVWRVVPGEYALYCGLSSSADSSAVFGTLTLGV